MLARTLVGKLTESARTFPAVFLTGPRQSGKTTLARAVFPGYKYVLLEERDVREEAVQDPRGFLKRLENLPGIIIDEAQRAPGLFSYLQGFLDDRRSGPVILTGSQNFLMLEKITQSLAGRVAVLTLLPFSMAELDGRAPIEPDDFAVAGPHSASVQAADAFDVIHKGFFPAIHDRGAGPSSWLDGYLQTYIERDVRSITNIGDLDTFIRFIALCAGRAGQLLNTSALGADAGVSHQTVRRWLSVLQASYVVSLLQPYHRNFSKRVVKTPKLYFTDTGLLCNLLGIKRKEDISVNPLRGAIFENFVLVELFKLFMHRGLRPPLFFWRDSAGSEVDVVIEQGARLVPVEVKSGQTFVPEWLAGLDRFCTLSGAGRGVVVFGGAETFDRGRHLVRSWMACT